MNSLLLLAHVYHQIIHHNLQMTELLQALHLICTVKSLGVDGCTFMLL
jgi:hypothetical protein